MTMAGPARGCRLAWVRAGVAAALASIMVLTACNGDNGNDDQDDATSVRATILEPADSATDVITATEIVFSTENAVEVTVELTELNGASIDGKLREDGSRWLPAGQLAYNTTYVATVTAVGSDGTNAIDTSTFTTMPEPEQTIRVFSFLGNDAVVGVGMPLRIEFKDDTGALQPIPEENRPEVERRLTVRTDPPQEGSWHWVSGSELHYRPREFWQPGTQIHYHAATGGLPVGDGQYLRNDLNVSVTVGPEIIMSADATTLQMTVTVDGEVQRSIPVSLGRPEFPTSSGTFVIMEKFRETVFDTREELGEDGYVVDIEYAMRTTYGGEFLHATVRSGEELGTESVTHGCINMARDNAEWLFNLTHAWGDPVIVTGTSRQVELGNGWTDWNLDWEQYRQGSALYSG